MSQLDELNIVQLALYTDDMNLSREAIVKQGLSLLDTYGLPDVSMRRIASMLGVQPSALYWHVSSKQELLAAMAEVILADLPPFPSSDLARVPAWAARFHGLLMRHPNGAELVWSVLSLQDQTTGLGAQIEKGLSKCGVPSNLVHGASRGILYLILGHGFDEDQRAQAAQLGVVDQPHRADSATTLDDAVALFIAGIRTHT